MGYTTEFWGEIEVSPPLNEHEISYLKDFADSRRMDRTEGPYYAVPGDDFGQTQSPGIRNYNKPPVGQPGLWCQWVPAPSGDAIEWDGSEKFYHPVEWMQYLIHHFLCANAVASRRLVASVRQDPRFAHFTFDHTLNGTIDAQGEDPDDRWRLIVEDNKVFQKRASLSWD